MVAVHPLRVLLLAFSGWMRRQQSEFIEYLVEENRVLEGQMQGRALRRDDDQRRRLSRLAALIPRPRVHLLTYHGVLAPAAEWRDLVVPSVSPARVKSSPIPEPSLASGSALTPKAHRPTRASWADLMKRVFAIDVLVCPHCAGTRKLIALLTDGLVVRKILAHLGLSTEPPPRAPARAPPEHEFAW